ncbi:transmembrane protein [Actinidia rufa]|uniref:Transmembrane protein n=1 Tax=Actinidia rufa TaxID=165716 RepID=A0A7J0FMY3_9ERIC|nr:transmembrane protein [Actinidia rufa]
MAYVDHAFSISDEDIMMESSYSINNRPPIKEIALALSLLVFGTASESSSAFSWPSIASAETTLTGFSLRYWGRFCSFRGSIIRGLHTTPTRATKVSLSLISPLAILYMSNGTASVIDTLHQRG